MSTTDLTYREDIFPTDKDVIGEIVQSTNVFTVDEIKIAVELAEESLRKGTDSGYSFLFAEQSGKTLGYTCFGPIPGTTASFDLYWIAVHKNYQRAGIGSKLLAITESKILQQGGRRIYIETSSTKQYEDTRRFYLNSGYREEALLKDFYSPGNNKVIYIKVF